MPDVTQYDWSRVQTATAAGMPAASCGLADSGDWRAKHDRRSSAVTCS
jgi:hypothetical protein